jgi:DNA-binding protein H-NS
MPSYEELLTKKAQLDAELKKVFLDERKLAIDDMRQKMARYRISISELFGRRRNAETRKRPAPKYRDPTSGATWSGRGKPPVWIKEATDRNALLIVESET